MTRDANEIAREYARTREKLDPEPTVVGSRAPVVGTLTIWKSVEAMSTGANWIVQSQGVTLDLSKPGLLIAYDVEDGDAEIFATRPGWYINFVPNREGE